MLWALAQKEEAWRVERQALIDEWSAKLEASKGELGFELEELYEKLGRVVPPPAFPEVPEHEDELEAHGLRLGSEGFGRAPLGAVAEGARRDLEPHRPASE